jgi:hypothetical protein
MFTCPSCFALLRESDIDATAALQQSIERGVPMGRPAGRRAFALGPACTVRRLRPHSVLVVTGADGFVEASVEGSAPTVALPLCCADGLDVLFRLEEYRAADRAVVAVGPDGDAIATFLRAGGVAAERLEVRDETSAPVARLSRAPGVPGLRLVETGTGAVLAHLERTEPEHDLWSDDEWTLTPASARNPLAPLALVALTVAAKVLLGAPEATTWRPDEQGVGPALQSTALGYVASQLWPGG